MTTTTTEALPAIQLTQPPTIITKQCSRSWLAWIGNDPTETESGITEAEAVGNLHLRFPGLFGTVQRQETL